MAEYDAVNNNLEAVNRGQKMANYGQTLKANKRYDIVFVGQKSDGCRIERHGLKK